MKFRIIIPRVAGPPVQAFSDNAKDVRDVAKMYLSHLPEGHVAKVYEISEVLSGTIRSAKTLKGELVFEENFLDSSQEIAETGDGKEQTTDVNV